MYKIVVCNLGYENKNLQDIDKKIGDIESLMRKIKRIKPITGKMIEGFKITNINYNVTEKDFEKTEAINVIETEDCNRCIYISKL